MTTPQHNPDEVARLIAEAREDDARMTLGEWTVDDWGALGHILVNGKSAGISSMGSRADAAAIARTRNNLRAMADQLEAAQVEIERLNDDVLVEVAEERDEARAERDKLRADLADMVRSFEATESEAEQLRTLVQALRFDTDQRDKLQAELEAARREVAEMRPVAEAAERQRDRNDDDTDDMFAAVDAYRAARDKAGDRG